MEKISNLSFLTPNSCPQSEVRHLKAYLYVKNMTFTAKNTLKLHSKDNKVDNFIKEYFEVTLEAIRNKMVGEKESGICT